MGYGGLIRQKPANLLFAFAGASTEPPRASWGRPTRSSNDCRVRFPAWERQPPGARSISPCVLFHEHPLQASIAFDPSQRLPRRFRPRHRLPQLPAGGQAAASRSVPAPPHLGGPAGSPLTLRFNPAEKKPVTARPWRAPNRMSAGLGFQSSSSSQSRRRSNP